jgi:hypothetical protein
MTVALPLQAQLPQSLLHDQVESDGMSNCSTGCSKRYDVVSSWSPGIGISATATTASASTTANGSGPGSTATKSEYQEENSYHEAVFPAVLRKNVD